MTRRDDIFCNEVQGHKFMSQTFYAKMFSIRMILFIIYTYIMRLNLLNGVSIYLQFHTKKQESLPQNEQYNIF